jgi:hypothetical protein
MANCAGPGHNLLLFTKTHPEVYNSAKYKMRGLGE